MPQPGAFFNMFQEKEGSPMHYGISGEKAPAVYGGDESPPDILDTVSKSDVDSSENKSSNGTPKHSNSKKSSKMRLRALHTFRQKRGVNNNASRLHADRDACKGSTDTPEGATLRLKATLEPQQEM